MKYVNAAFLNQWNLLAFLGGTAFAILSGAPDVLLPLVLAAETGYLGLLASHPRFQKAIDAQAAAVGRDEVSRTTQRTLERILRTLPPKTLERFSTLRARCLELRQLATELKNPLQQQADLPFEESQTAGLDRLLWMYLRLLFTQFSLSRFLQKTRPEQIERDIEQVQARLAKVPAENGGLQEQRIRKALVDNLATYEERLANLRKAQDNLQLVELQIDQLENRIHSLSEMAVNRQEPEFISTQVEHVADSMKQTEDTISELRFATGLDAINEETPKLLRAVQAKLVE
jgi:hypothetical protein